VWVIREICTLGDKFSEYTFPFHPGMCVFVLQIDIVGHSGDSDEIPFVNSSSPPSNDKERLQILKVWFIMCSCIACAVDPTYNIGIPRTFF